MIVINSEKEVALQTVVKRKGKGQDTDRITLLENILFDASSHFFILLHTCFNNKPNVLAQCLGSPTAINDYFTYPISSKQYLPTFTVSQ